MFIVVSRTSLPDGKILNMPVLYTKLYTCFQCEYSLLLSRNLLYNLSKGKSVTKLYGKERRREETFTNLRQWKWVGGCENLWPIFLTPVPRKIKRAVPYKKLDLVFTANRVVSCMLVVESSLEHNRFPDKTFVTRLPQVS